MDVVAKAPDGKRILISLKWQQVSGTAEEKVPYEVISLYEALTQGHGDKAYIVLGGPGWRLRDFFLSEKFLEYFREGLADKLRVVSLEDFLALANQGNL